MQTCNYVFDITYPLSEQQQLEQIQNDVLRKYSRCKYTDRFINPGNIHNTVYTTDSPEDIPHIATVLKSANPQIFIAFVGKDDRIIFYHTEQLKLLAPDQKMMYKQLLEKLPGDERIVHDYLLNVYEELPV